MVVLEYRERVDKPSYGVGGVDGWQWDTAGVSKSDYSTVWGLQVRSLFMGII